VQKPSGITKPALILGFSRPSGKATASLQRAVHDALLQDLCKVLNTLPDIVAIRLTEQ